VILRRIPTQLQRNLAGMAKRTYPKTDAGFEDRKMKIWKRIRRQKRALHAMKCILSIRKNSLSIAAQELRAAFTEIPSHEDTLKEKFHSRSEEQIEIF